MSNRGRLRLVQLEQFEVRGGPDPARRSDGKREFPVPFTVDLEDPTGQKVFQLAAKEGRQAVERQLQQMREQGGFAVSQFSLPLELAVATLKQVGFDHAASAINRAWKAKKYLAVTIVEGQVIVHRFN